MLRYKLKDKDRICTSVKLVNPLSNNMERTINAVWDTGATNTTVTPEVADELALLVLGSAFVNVAGSDTPQPSELVFGKVVLEDYADLTSAFCKNKLPKGIDILIGMDLVSNDKFTLYAEDDTLVFEFGTMDDIN